MNHIEVKISLKSAFYCLKEKQCYYCNILYIKLSKSKIMAKNTQRMPLNFRVKFCLPFFLIFVILFVEYFLRFLATLHKFKFTN